MKRVYFVRHGESAGNAEGVFKDPQAEMTEKGHEQAKVLASRCATMEIEKIISSPNRRAVQTAEYISEACNRSFTQEPYFAATKYASRMVGKPKQGPEAQEYFRILKELYADPEARYEDAENFTDIKARYTAGLEYLAAADETVIVSVTHEATLMALTMHILLDGQQTVEQHIGVRSALAKFDHSGVMEVQYDGECWKLVAWNDRIA